MTMYYNGYEYQQRSPLSETEGFLLASVVSSAILSPLPYIGKNFSKQINKELPKNHLYKDCFVKSFDLSGLKEKGVEIIEAQHADVPMIYKLGHNACFDPNTNKVILNTDKMSAAGVHELGHAMNALKSKFGVKYLAKLRAPGYAIAGLMEYFAIFSRTKPKGAPKSLTDIIEDNCGIIAFIAMLPTVLEEGIASLRGMNLAKKAGASKELLKGLEKVYMKAHATYSAKAILGGLAVYASRKIMDYYTRPKLVE